MISEQTKKYMCDLCKIIKVMIKAILIDIKKYVKKNIM